VPPPLPQASKSRFLRQFPELYVTSYQGSEVATSEGILKVFLRAEQYRLRNPAVLVPGPLRRCGPPHFRVQQGPPPPPPPRAPNPQRTRRPPPVVHLDEIGLAELSPANPLKVLHALLEPDYPNDRPNVAVVGISNYPMDPAKMNRGVHLQVPAAVPSPCQLGHAAGTHQPQILGDCIRRQETDMIVKILGARKSTHGGLR